MKFNAIDETLELSFPEVTIILDVFDELDNVVDTPATSAAANDLHTLLRRIYEWHHTTTTAKELWVEISELARSWNRIHDEENTP